MKAFWKLLGILLCVLLLTGCWDYQGLNQQTIVVGLAVDMEEEDVLNLTFEILDLNAFDGGGFTSLLLETQGKTLIEAIHKVGSLLHNNVYLGTLDVLIISEEVARTRGIGDIIFQLTREQNVRNSMQVLVAGTHTAAELLKGASDGQESAGTILSTTLGESLNQGERGGLSTTDPKALFEAFNALQGQWVNFTVPIIIKGAAEDIPFSLGGLAIFRDSYMVGTLGQEEMPLYLLATNRVHGMVLPLEIQGERVVAYILSSRRNLDGRQVGDNLHFHLDVSLSVKLLSLPTQWEQYEPWVQRELEGQVAEEIGTFIRQVQEMGEDILGFSTHMQGHHPRLWEKREGHWETYFQNAQVSLTVEVAIRDFGMIGG